MQYASPCSFVEWGVWGILSVCQAPDPVFSVTHTQTPLTEMSRRARNCGFNFQCDDHRPRAILTMTLKDDVVPRSIYDWDLSDQRSRSISSSSLLWRFSRHFWSCESFTLARKCYSDRQWRIAEKQWRRKRMTWLGDVLWSSCLWYLLRRSQHLAVVIFLELWSPQWLSGGKTVSAYNCLVMEDRGKLICRLCTTLSGLYYVIRLWRYSWLFHGETGFKFQPVCKMPRGNIKGLGLPRILSNFSPQNNLCSILSTIMKFCPGVVDNLYFMTMIIIWTFFCIWMV